MIRLVKMLLVAGSVSLQATPASAIPFGIDTTGDSGAWTFLTDGPVVASSQLAGSNGSFDVPPSVVSWRIGRVFCPCSWTTTLGGTKIEAASSWGGGFLNFRRTFLSATD